MIEKNIKKLAAAGLSGSLAGQRAINLFHKIQTASVEISKCCEKSPDDISKMIMDKHKTTSLSVDQSIDEIRIEQGKS